MNWPNPKNSIYQITTVKLSIAAGVALPTETSSPLTHAFASTHSPRLSSWPPRRIGNTEIGHYGRTLSVDESTARVLRTYARSERELRFFVPLSKIFLCMK